MPRKSPRSRRKAAVAPRVPGAVRAPASPRKRTRKRRATGVSHNGSNATGRHRPASPSRRRATRTIAKPKTRRAGRPAGDGEVRSPARRRPKRFAPPDPARVGALVEILDRTYPEARCALDFGTPLQLLIATILSAQCTDARVNQVTPGLFARYRDAEAFAAASLDDLEAMIRSTGFFRNKARAIRECCADIVAKHRGEVPRTLEQLTELRGVGRKTANVVLGNAYGIPGLVVDTHVTRLSNRLGLTDQADAVKIEFALMDIVPRERWTVFSHWLILHGRQVCIARKPRCSVCPLLPHCPKIGVARSE